MRDRKYLIEALDITPPFLRTKQGDAGAVIDYRNWQLALGRRFRSLKFWFVLRSYGVEGFQKHIRKGIALNDSFVSLVEKSPILSLVTPPSFSLTVFRLNPSAGIDAPVSLEALNKLNRAFFGRVSARTDIYLTQTMLNDVYCVRFAVGSAWTEEQDIKAAFDVIQKEAELAIEAWKVSESL